MLKDIINWIFVPYLFLTNLAAMEMGKLQLTSVTMTSARLILAGNKPISVIIFKLFKLVVTVLICKLFLLEDEISASDLTTLLIIRFRSTSKPI